MNEAELRKLLADARDALERGASYNDINEYIRGVTDGQFAGMMSLTVAVDPEAEADRRLAESVNNKTPISDFLRAMAEGATFGTADELVGMFGGDAEASRARMDQIRADNPGAALAGEIAGAVAVPGAGAARAFRALRGAGGVARTAGAGAAVGAAEGAAMGAGTAEPGGRFSGALGGGAAGGFTGGLLSGGGGVASKLLSPLRPNQSVANQALREMVDATGIPREQIGQKVRTLPEGGVVADVDPVLERILPSVVRQGQGLRRSGGPVQRVIRRGDPATFGAARRAIFEPLEQSFANVDDPALRNLVTSDPAVVDAAKGLINRDPSKVRDLSFRQLQSIRERLQKRRNSRSITSVQREEVVQALGRLDNALDVAVPGFREARRQYAQLITQQKGYERLASAIEAAVPTFRPDLPSKIEGLGATARNLLMDQQRRRQQIAEMVGEILLEEGEEGARRIERMIRDGEIAKLFSHARSRGRTAATTQAGRAGGGLLSSDVRLGIEYDPETGETRRGGRR